MADDLPPELQKQMVCLRMRYVAANVLMKSRAIFEKSREYYKSQGIGAFVIIFNSATEMEDAVETSRFNLEYVALQRVAMMNYKHGFDLVCRYDPTHSFVLLFGLQTHPNTFSFVSCIAPQNVDEQIRMGLLSPE